MDDQTTNPTQDPAVPADPMTESHDNGQPADGGESQMPQPVAPASEPAMPEPAAHEEGGETAPVETPHTEEAHTDENSGAVN